MTAIAPELIKEWIPQYSIEDFGLEIHRNGIEADPDGNAVTVSMLNRQDGQVVFSGRAATREEEGFYIVSLTSADTQTTGIYDLHWIFAFTSAPQEAVSPVEVGPPSPLYSALDTDMRGIVDSVWDRFADLFDSPLGGPHLQVYFQTRMSRDRLARLLRVAVGRLNSVAQPYQTYSIDEPGRFPVVRWGPLLEQAMYVEAIKHLIRSYTEMPAWEGVPGARAERRDYQERWRTVLEMEAPDLERALEVFKISNMGLGRPHVLISGGVYGRYGPTRLTGSAASRPRYWARFY